MVAHEKEKRVSSVPLISASMIEAGYVTTDEEIPLNNKYIDALCRVHIDMHTPEWDTRINSCFDAEQVISTIAAAGAKGVVVFAKDCYGNAYYPTAYGHTHRCIGKRDILAEFIQACRLHDMGVAVYFCAIWDNHAVADHPEWRMLGPDGKPVSDTTTAVDQSRWKYICHNSVFADLAENMIREIASNYEVDGFHIDMFNMDFGGLSCYCDTCAALFREATGKELPRIPTWDGIWRRFLEFRYDSVERYMLRLREAVKGISPDCPVVMNYHASPGFDWRVGQKPVRHSLPSDMSTGETYTPMLGEMYPGLETRYLADLTPGKPVDLVSWRMNRTTDFSTKPREQLRWELYSSLALGAKVMLIEQPFHDGWLDEQPYKTLIRDIFTEIEAKRDLFKGRTQRHVGIYYSCRNRDYYGRCEQERFQQPIMGGYKALVENQFDVGFLFDETLSAGRLAEFPVVYLPNVAAMTLHEAELFRAYVAGGGKLVATFDTSLFSEHGEHLEEFRLSDVFGVRFLGVLDCDSHYLRAIPEPFGEGIDPDCFILTVAQANRVEASTAIGYGDLHDSFFKKEWPDRFFSHSMHPPFTRLMPAVFENAFGKGKAYYLPTPIDLAYAGAHEGPEHRILLRNVFRAAGYTPPVRIKAPLNVESVVRHQEKRAVVHLLAFNPLRRSTTLPSLDRLIRPSLRMEEAPIFRAVIETDRPVASAKAWNATTQVRMEDRRIELLCEDVHEAIVLEWA